MVDRGVVRGLTYMKWAELVGFLGSWLWEGGWHAGFLLRKSRGSNILKGKGLKYHWAEGETEVQWKPWPTAWTALELKCFWVQCHQVSESQALLLTLTSARCPRMGWDPGKAAPCSLSQFFPLTLPTDESSLKSHLRGSSVSTIIWKHKVLLINKILGIIEYYHTQGH